MKLKSRLNHLPAFLAALLIPATTLLGSSFVSPAHAQPESKPKCSLATIKGSYAIHLTGWIGSGVNRVPYASAGTFVADGNGYLPGVDTVVIDGAEPIQRIVTATYTVDPNPCSGTAISPSAGSFNFFRKI